MTIKIFDLAFTKKKSNELQESKSYLEDLYESIKLYKSDEEKRKSINAFLFVAHKLQENKYILRKTSSLKHFNIFSYCILFIAINATIYFMCFDSANIKGNLANTLILFFIMILSSVIYGNYIFDMYKESNDLNMENEKIRNEFVLIKIDERIKKLSMEDKNNILEYLEKTNFKSETYNFTKSLFIDEFNKPL